MSKIIIQLLLVPLCLLTAFSFPLYGTERDTTLNYFEGSWEEALVRSAETGKPMMLSILANWCYWCKAMKETTFKDPEVLDILNNEFMLFRANAEEKKGEKLSAKFRATSLPVLIFIDSEGRLIDKNTGYIRDNREFTKTLSSYLESPEPLKANIDVSDLDPGFPGFYLSSFDSDEDWSEEEFTVKAFQFLDQLDRSECMDEVAWSVMFRFGIVMAEMGAYFLENYHQFVENFGEAETFAHLNNLYNYYMFIHAQRGEEEEALQLINLLSEFEPEREEELGLRYKVSFYMQSRDWNKVLDQLENHLRTSNDPQLNSINSVCLNIHDATSDREILNRAATVMGKVTEIEPAYQHLDTQASLLFRAGKTQKGIEVAEKAIEVGEKAGIDVTDTEYLLEIYGNR